MENRSPFAVVIGDINIEIITPPFDPQIFQTGETSCVLDNFTMSLGGNAINVAATIAGFHDSSHIYRGYGRLCISDWIRKRCDQLGINTSLGTIEGKTAGIIFAMTYIDGRCQFVATLGTNKLITPPIS